MPEISLRNSRTYAFSLVKIPFAVPLGAGVVGVVADRLLGGSTTFWMTVFFLQLIAALIFIGMRRTPLALAFLCGATVASFATWHHVHWSLYPDDEISRFAPADSASSTPICMEAIVIRQPKLVRMQAEDPLSTVPGGDRTRLTIQAKRLRRANTWELISGRADVLIDGHLLAVNAGDRLRLTGRLKRVSAPMNPGERDFRKFARADRKLCQLRVPYPDCIQVLEGEQRVGWTATLQRLRGRCHASLDQYIDEPYRPLAAALFLGLRDAMPREQTEAFFLTGTMHLLAISGLHVGILACGFFFAARRGLIPFRTSLIAIMLFILGYAMLTEARPPVLRAAILIQIVCLSWLARRRPSAFNSLSLAALIVLLINPADLFRIGTQLSFLAVATLSWFGRYLVSRPPEDPLDRLIWRTRSISVRCWHAIRNTTAQMLAASFCVWMMALPLTMSEFHLVSPLAVVLNVILFIPVAASLFSGMTVILFGDLLPPLASFAAVICNTSLGSIQSTVDWSLELPVSHFWVAGMHPLWTATFYIGMVVAILFVRPTIRWSLVGLVAWFAFPAMYHVVATQIPDKSLDCTFVSVGHGTCVIVELPSGKTMMYDCGHLGNSKSAVEVISSVLWHKRISHLDAVVLSHADADHYNALPGLLERFSVGVVYTGPKMFDPNSDALRLVDESIQEFGIAKEEIEVGCVFRTKSGTRIEIRHPSSQHEYESDNAKSLVLEIDYGLWKLLLPGDIERDGLDGLVTQPIADCDLVMAPHHGSLHSEPQRFLAWSNPDWSIISSMRRPDTQQSIEAYRAVQGTVFHTAIHGAVFVHADAEHFTVGSFIDVD